MSLSPYINPEIVLRPLAVDIKQAVDSQYEMNHDSIRGGRSEYCNAKFKSKEMRSYNSQPID